MVPSREARWIEYFGELDSGLDSRACHALSRWRIPIGMARSSLVEVGNGPLDSENSVVTGTQVATDNPSEHEVAFDNLMGADNLAVIDSEDKVCNRIDLKAYKDYVGWNWDTSYSRMD
jgi:hypothetical protein